MRPAFISTFRNTLGGVFSGLGERLYNKSELIFYSKGLVEMVNDYVTLRSTYPKGNNTVLQREPTALIGDGTGYGTFAEAITLSGDFEFSCSFKISDLSSISALLGTGYTDRVYVLTTGAIIVQIDSVAATFIDNLISVDTVYNLTITRVGSDVTLDFGTASETQTITSADFPIDYVGTINGTTYNLNGNLWDLTINGTTYPMCNTGGDVEYPSSGDNIITWSSFVGDPVQATGDGTGSNWVNENGWSTGVYLSEDIPRTLTVYSGSPVIDGDTVTFSVGEAQFVRETGYWEIGKYYESNLTIVDSSFSGGLEAPYDGSGPGDSPTGAGEFINTYSPDSSTHMYIYSDSSNGSTITVNHIREVSAPGAIVPGTSRELADGGVSYPGPIRPNQKLGGFACVQGDGAGYFDTGVAGEDIDVLEWTGVITADPSSPAELVGAYNTNFRVRINKQVATNTFVIGLGQTSDTIVTTGDVIGRETTIRLEYSGGSYTVDINGEEFTDTYVGAAGDSTTLFIQALSSAGSPVVIATSEINTLWVKAYSSGTLMHHWVAENTGSSPEIMQDIVGGQDAVGQSISGTLYTTTDLREDVPAALSNGYSVDWTSSEELVTNGGFDTDTDWTPSNNDWTITGGKAVCANAPGASQNINQTGNGQVQYQEYETTYTISDYVSGTVYISLGGSLGTARTANGTYTEVITAAATDYVRILTSTGAGFTGSVDNVSVRRHYPGITVADSNGLMPDGVSTPDYPANDINALYNLPGITLIPTGQSVQEVLGTSALTIEDMDIIDEDIQVFAGGKAMAVYDASQDEYAESIGLRCGCLGDQAYDSMTIGANLTESPTGTLNVITSGTTNDNRAFLYTSPVVVSSRVEVSFTLTGSSGDFLYYDYDGGTLEDMGTITPGNYTFQSTTDSLGRIPIYPRTASMVISNLSVRKLERQ